MRILLTCLMSSTVLAMASPAAAAPPAASAQAKDTICILDSKGVEKCVPPKSVTPQSVASEAPTAVVHGAQGTSSRPQPPGQGLKLYKDKQMKKPGLVGKAGR